MKNSAKLFKFGLAVAIATAPMLGCGEPPPVPQKSEKDLAKKKTKPAGAKAHGTDGK
jgi:hypothetical protein